MQTRTKVFLYIALCSFGLGVAAWTQESKPAPAQRPVQAGGVQPRPSGGDVGIASVNTNRYNPSTDKDEATDCKKNLEAINIAIQAFQKDHQALPNSLADLGPKYLADTNVLICPVTKRTGSQSAFGVLDTKVYSSYLFEFSPNEIPAIVKGAWPGPKMTMREWKQQQMKLAGSNVPIVRCLLHDPALNLGVGGTVYESPVYWELNFTNATTKLEDFTPH